MSDSRVSDIRVVVADDQTAIREALVTVLDLMPGITVVGSAADGAEAVALAGGADVVLMDLDMPGMGGVEATRVLAVEHPGVAVVVLTTLADQTAIVAALQAGALGYLTKQSGRADIVRAVQAAAAGQSVLDPAVQLRLVQAVAPAAPPPSRVLPDDLTAREVEVLTLVGRGLANRAIARQLFIGEATVKTHVNHLFQKLAITQREDAAQLARDCGLV